MPSKCDSCGTEIIWLKSLPTEKNPNPKANPIEVKPHKDGNLIIDRTRKLYRFATPSEKEYAKFNNKNLYISHFSTCKFANDHRK